MGGDKSVFDEELPGDDTVYQGRLGRTTMSSVLWRAPSGQMTSVRIYSVVNAATDPVLAERLCAGTLNWVRVPDEEQLYPVRTPVLYHDEANRRFILVLPDDFRARELAERSDLFERLSRDTTHPIPGYILNFEVTFGHEELSRRVVGGAPTSTRDVEVTPVRSIPNEYLETTVRVANPERLDRQEAEPSLAAKEEAQEPSPRAVLQAEAEAIIEQMESIDGWPDEPTATRTQMNPGEDLLDAGPIDLSEDIDSIPDEVFEAEDVGATLEEESKPAQEAEPASEESEKEAAPTDETGGASEKETARDAVVEAQEATASIQEAPPAAAADVLPEQLEPWKEAEHPDPVLYTNEDGVVLAACVEGDLLKELVGQDFSVLLQLHRMERYPLVVLAVVAEKRDQNPLFWLLNILGENHLDILERLAVDFRMEVDIYDDRLHRVLQRRIHMPLEENAKLVRQKAMEHLTQMGDAEPDWESAVKQWADPTFARLGAREHAFSDRAFSDLNSPAQTAMALGVIDWWVEPPHQDYLILVKSFSVVWWRKIKNRVVHKAMEYGLWLPEHLLTWALQEGFATSRRDLLRHSIDRFCETVQDEFKPHLELQSENDNWRALLEEAAQSGVVVVSEAEQLAERTRKRIEDAAQKAELEQAQSDQNRQGQETSPVPIGPDDLIEEPDRQGKEQETSPVPLDPDDLIEELDEEKEEQTAVPLQPGSGPLGLWEMDTSTLMDLLDNKDTRLPAALVLAERQDTAAVDALYATVQMMTRAEVLQVLPMLIAFGSVVEPHLVKYLRSNKSFLRQGAALALGILRSSSSIEAMVECLLAEPTGIWREIARVLGEIGPATQMTLTSKIQGSTAESRERIAWTLAHVTAASGRSDFLDDLAQSSDSTTAALARRALESIEEAQAAATIEMDDAVEEEGVVASFTRKFLQSLTENGRELSDDDILDEDDEDTQEPST